MRGFGVNGHVRMPFGIIYGPIPGSAGHIGALRTVASGILLRFISLTSRICAVRANRAKMTK